MRPVFSSTSYDCHKYLPSERSEQGRCANDNCNVLEMTGLILKLCDGDFITPFPILKMIFLQNIKIQVKT